MGDAFGATVQQLVGIPMDQYVRDTFAGERPPSLNSSVAHQLITRSPRHAWTAHPRLNPAWAVDEETRFDIGTAAHGLLLEGKRGQIVALDYDDWRRKEAKAAKAAARAEGKIPLLAHQAADVVAMVDEAKASLATCTDLRDLGELDAETTFLWQEGEAWCRCRPDWITRDRAIVLSYKTTGASAEAEAFTRGILLGSGYDVQAAFESRAIELLTGKAPTYVWMVQECEPPYAVSFLGLTRDMADLGRQKYDEAVTTWARCVSTDRWPAYPSRIQYVEPPAWARTQWLERQATVAAGYVDDGRPVSDQLMGDTR